MILSQRLIIGELINRQTNMLTETTAKTRIVIFHALYRTFSFTDRNNTTAAVNTEHHQGRDIPIAHINR